MPIVPSTYQAPPFFTNGHLQTIYANIVRFVPAINYTRERITTPDGDFLDLDWSRVGSKRLVIISHGLEGSSAETHIRGMIRAFNKQGWDALAWNYRGCGGTPNLKLRSYHSGATEDLEHVIASIPSSTKKIALVGFSLGGNLTLKYLGERGNKLDSRLVGAVTFSVPCNLKATSQNLARLSNRIYMIRFRYSLWKKVRSKIKLFPGEINDRGFFKIRTFEEFDNRYTAPLHGFKNADDYWHQCSSERYLAGIKLPTLLVNALDDPFLTPACFPFEIAEKNRFLTLEAPAHGGHVGFVAFNRENLYWSEKRAFEFLKRLNPLK